MQIEKAQSFAGGIVGPAALQLHKAGPRHPRRQNQSLIGQAIVEKLIARLGSALGRSRQFLLLELLTAFFGLIFSGFLSGFFASFSPPASVPLWSKEFGA